ncbi:hypothetical protein [Halorussus salinus]|uniref:hypothetical protein n=1 Tax=Halorussus salinus TaxID=1364935 RepID=UPI001091C615|nr:hypothetical protein [Halorussus salinus]
MNAEQTRAVARNVFRFGLVLLAYVVADSLWISSGYQSDMGVAQLGALVCLLGIGLDLFAVFETAEQ